MNNECFRAEPIKRIEKHMNNAGQTSKNIRITQVGIELAPNGAFLVSNPLATTAHLPDTEFETRLHVAPVLCLDQKCD